MATSDSTPLKRCSKCGVEYPATPEYFYRETRTESEFRNPCKACVGAKSIYRDIAVVSVTEPNAVGIPLTHEFVAIVDKEDSDLAQHRWHIQKSRGEYTYAAGYLSGNQNHEYVYLHRLIMSRVTGRDLAPDEQVDHKNGNKLDCRRSNLRFATPTQNGQNKKRQKRNKSGYKGVWWNSRLGRWETQVKIHGTSVYTGHFDTPEEAYEAYCEMAKKYYGEFARFE